MYELSTYIMKDKSWINMGKETLYERRLTMVKNLELYYVP